jgi:Fur family transcriptional regulator, ferric uptake regulator
VVNIDAKLKAAGLKRTPVRVGVMEVLGRASAPLAAPQVMEGMPAETDTVTVYRTLNTLTDKKLVHRVRGDDRVWRYALSEHADRARHDHAHFVCEECGSVECLRDLPLPQRLLDELTPRKQYRVTYSEVVMHGLCPKCNP